MAAQNAFPGKVEIQQAFVFNKLGMNSIVNNLLTIDIYEDIYAPFVYCDILVIDYNKLSSGLPFIGEEFFQIEFKTENGETISYLFFLYQQDKGGIVSNNKAQGYTLHGVTIERAFDNAKTVSRAYKGTYASIAGQIFDDYVKKDTGLEFNYQQTKSIARYIPPLISPLQAIEYCRRRAVPSNPPFTSYLFFRNARGYHFTSINGLFNMAANQMEGVTHVFGSKSPDPQLSDEETVGGMQTRSDIIAFDPQAKYNTVDKIDRGAYNTISYSFDLTTKSFVQRKSFNLSKGKGSFVLGSAGEFNTEEFLETFEDARCGVSYVPTDFSIELEGTQTDFYPDAVAEMNSYMHLVGQQQAGIIMYGDSSITSGQVINLLVYKPSDEETVPSIDETHSGAYLLSRVRHQLTFGTNNTYEIHATGIRGSMANTVRGLQQNA